MELEHQARMSKLITTNGKRCFGKAKDWLGKKWFMSNVLVSAWTKIQI